MARLHNRGSRGARPAPAYNAMDGMSDSMAHEALTSHPSFKKSQTRFAHHLKKTAAQLMKNFVSKDMPQSAAGHGPRRRESVMAGRSRGKASRQMKGGR